LQLNFRTRSNKERARESAKMLLAVVVMAGGLLVAQAIPDRHAVLTRTGQVVLLLYTDKKKTKFPSFIWKF
jgi:hypothetical protein